MPPSERCPLGMEPGEAGLMVGRDPRKMTTVELTAMGHEPKSPLKALRERCLDCCSGQPAEVRRCVAVACPAWPFRLGHSPWRSERKLTDEQREAYRERGRRLAASQRSGSNIPAGSINATPAGQENFPIEAEGTGSGATALPSSHSPDETRRPDVGDAQHDHAPF